MNEHILYHKESSTTSARNHTFGLAAGYLIIMMRAHTHFGGCLSISITFLFTKADTQTASQAMKVPSAFLTSGLTRQKAFSSEEGPKQNSDKHLDALFFP